MIPSLETQRSPVPARVPAGPRPGHAPDFTPVKDAACPGASAAEALLEAPFRPAPEELLSFLVNGLCLFGGHRVLEWEPGSGSPAAALEALGHAVTGAGPGLPPPRAGGYDRAFRAGRAFGYGDEADRLWLRAMRRALQPGGLLLFHAFDRDRAYGLAERLAAGAAPGEAAGAAYGPGRAAFAFDPRTGRLTARVRPRDVTEPGGEGRPGAPASGGRGCPRASVRAYNLAELEALLAGSGFSLAAAYGDWQGGAPEPAGARTGRLLIVASKDRPARKGAGRGLGGARLRRGKIPGMRSADNYFPS